MSKLHGERKADRTGRMRFDSLRAAGSSAVLLVGCAALLSLGGCPGAVVPPGGEGPPEPPVPTAGFSVTITSTEGILQRNEQDFTTNFERSSTLGVVVTQPTDPGEEPQTFTVSWSIDASDEMPLAFNVGAGFAQTTTGESVSVEVLSAPSAEVTQVIRAVVTLADGLELDGAAIVLTIKPDISEGEATSLISNPWADPAVGLNSDNQFVLNAGVAGNQGNFAVRWAPVLSGLNSNIQLPADLTGETLTVTVAGPVSGIFSFRSVVTEAVAATGEEITTEGIVNVFLGQAALTLDAVVTRLLVSPTASSVGIRTTRIGGVDDVGVTADTFFYAFQILDENGLDVTSTAAITPDVSVADDDIVNDWTISGLSPEGDYRILVTVADSEGLMMGAASVTVSLTDGLSLAMETQFDRVGAGSGFSLRTVRGGGTANYIYTFDAIDSNGAAAATTFTPASGSVDNDLINNWALTGFAAPGTYRIFGTVTDGNGNFVTASTDVVVGDVFTLDVQSTDIVLAPGQAATLTFDRTGGAANFSYSFAETSPGADSGAFGTVSPTTVADDATVTWTAPNAPGAGAVEGVYLIEVTATDARGLRATDSLSILVQEDEPLSLDVRSTANIAPPAGTVTLTFDQSGGVGNYSYAFSTTGPNGGSSFGDASPKVAAGDTTTTWTAPAASGTTEGTYRIDVEVTDALANTARDSVFIVVQAADVLSLNVTSNAYVVAPSGLINLNFDRTGGETMFTYTYDATDPSGSGGAGTFGTGSPQTVADDLAETWTAPAAGAGVEGTYRIDVQVSDALTNTVQVSIFVLVQAADVLSLDVTSNAYVVAPSGLINLNFDRTGGETMFTYTYDATDPSGAGGAGTFGVGSPQTVADDLAETWTAPAAGAGVEGTYRIDVQVSDALTNTVQVSIFVLVQADDALSLDVTSNAYVVAPSGLINLNFDRTGGETMFTYTYDATDPSGSGGAGTFGTGSPQTVADDLAETWTAPAPGVGVEGTYRIDVQVQDALQNTFQVSIFILVQSDDHLSLDTTLRNYVVAPGIPIRVTGTVTGGQPNYDFSFAALDPQGAAAGTFDNANPGAGPALFQEVQYLPETTPATYRITASVTDGTNDQIDDTVFLLVTEDSSIVNADILVDPADDQDAAELGAAAGDILAAATQITMAATKMVIDAGALDDQSLTDARNLVFLIIDAAGADLTVSSLRINGTNARGDAIQEEITTVNTDGTITLGLWPFKTISNIVLEYANVAAGDTIQIGVGDRFGLSAAFQTTNPTDAFHIVVNGAAIDQNVTFLDPTNAADIVVVAADNLDFPTTAQQHVRLTDTAPDNAIDYAIQIGPQAPVMTLNVVASDHTLDFSDGDAAELTLQVTGGVPPYTFSYDSEGLTNAADTFVPASGQSTSGDASTLWTPDNVLVPEDHVIWVRVVDSAGTPNVASDSVIINVVP